MQDFLKYSRDMGIPTTTTLDVAKYISGQVENSRTPYILEERNMRFSQMDVFSRLIADRIIWVTGAVDDNMADVVSAQLLYLNSVDKTKDIRMYISSPGGSVYSGLMIVDTMDLIDADVATLNMSMAASMGSVLLSAGAKGKRSALRYSKVMLHQSSSGSPRQNIQDAQINMDEWVKLNNLLCSILAENTGKTAEQIKLDTNRDLWLDANESLAYGIIDEIVKKK